MILGFSSALRLAPATAFEVGREPLFHGACIQSQGAMLVVREPDLVIVQASANARGLLGFDDGLLGWTLADLGGDLVERLAPQLAQPLLTVPLALRSRLGFWDQAFDVLVHRPSVGGLVLELEPAEPVADLSAPVREGLGAVASAGSIDILCDRVAPLFRRVTDYDRVRLFRCDEDGDCELMADCGDADLASDFHFQDLDPEPTRVLRRLAERQRLHVLVDADQVPVPLRPRRSPLTGAELDLSGCVLRSVSPRHRQSLKRLGVRSTLVAALVVGGRLWGLLVCCHRSARHLPYETRAVCELLAEVTATRIAALDNALVTRIEFGVRRFEERMIASIARAGDWTPAFVEAPAELLELVDATGAALFHDGRWISIGRTPDATALGHIRDWVAGRSAGRLVATTSLPRDLPTLVDPAGTAKGVLATLVAGSGSECLLWFRPDQAADPGAGARHTGRAGVVPVAFPAERGGRRERAAGRSRSWRSAERTAARLVAESIADVVQQFRSVRVLIAQAQLAQIRSQLQVSEQPILIADAGGEVALLTRSLERLLMPGPRPIRRLEDFVALLEEPGDAPRWLEELVVMHQPWRGEIRFGTVAGGRRPFMLRADVVFFSPGQVLGFVFVLTDLAGRDAAAAARARLRAGLEGQRQPGPVAATPPGYRDLLAATLENARQTALESGARADPVRTRELVEDVRYAVDRSFLLLERLVRYAGQSNRGEPLQ